MPNLNLSLGVIVSLLFLAILMILIMVAKLYNKVGPHEALIVYGFRGKRVVIGHGTVIFPVV